MNGARDPLEAILRRMGEPSWLILRALDPSEPMPGIEIIRQVEEWLHQANYAYKRLDPSTLHYALKRMEEDGLVECAGWREVDVPGPRGATRRERRPVYVITGAGLRALSGKDLLDQVARSRASAKRQTPAWEG